MKRVTVILPSDKFQHRQILSGILSESRKFGAWQFSLELGDRTSEIVGASRKNACHGIIAMVQDVARRKEILSWHKPAVLINPPSGKNGLLPPPPPRTSYVIRDQRNVGRTAAEYFLGLGFTKFAFVGTATPASWSALRLVGFRNRLEKDGFSCRAFTDKNADSLSAWLRALPPGTALYTPDDERALQVIALCSDLGITVPDTLAVLGTDNDTLLCESTTPPLASIEMGGVNCGALCTRLLAKLMSRRKTEPLISLAYPNVVTRESSDVNHINDPFISKVIGIVRKDLSLPHAVDDLAAAAGVSRRTLELRARMVLGTSLKAEINSIRLNEAVRLLSNTALSAQEVSERCGFCSISHLNTRLKAAFGYSSSVFRYQDPQ